MTITDTLTAGLLELLEACDSMPEIAEQASNETLGHAVVGVRRSVYDTPAGSHKRTRDLERSISATGRGTRDQARVTVQAGEEYARAIEFGTRGRRIAAGAIVGIAKAQPYKPVYLGRSGQNPSAPGPFILPAAVFSVYQMAHLLKVLLHK